MANFLFVIKAVKAAKGVKMIIKGKRIRTPRPYLYEFSSLDSLYITVPLSEDDDKTLALYGFDISKDEITKRVPTPVRSATVLNADGRWIVHKDRPKEPRVFEREYSIVDWHGNHHSGTCFQTRMCYPRTLEYPKEIAFHIENGALYSPMFVVSEENMEDIKLAINIALEMFGWCELWTKDKAPVTPQLNQVVVPWEILKSGTKDKELWQKYVDKTTDILPKSKKTIIKSRHEHLWAQSPDFCVLGAQSFWGYVVYGFTSENIFVFECNRPDNATYIFRGDWEQASKLTKTEILAANIQESRIFHTQNWQKNVTKAVKCYEGECEE